MLIVQTILGYLEVRNEESQLASNNLIFFLPLDRLGKGIYKPKKHDHPTPQGEESGPRLGPSSERIKERPDHDPQRNKSQNQAAYAIIPVHNKLS
jgi:hypothetical protein